MFRTHRLLGLVSFAFLAAAPLLAGCAPQGMAQHVAAADVQTNTVTVVGQGEVRHKPDIARASVGVEVSAPTVVEASRSAAQRMSELIAALKRVGIAENDIQTSNFSINFERAYPGQPQPMPMAAPAPPPPPPPGSKGPAAPRSAPAAMAAPALEPAGLYRVSNTVSIVVRDLAKVGPVLDAAVAAGANNVWGVSFGLDKPEGLEPEARAKAMADARARAEALAKLAGRTLGEVVSVSDSPSGGGGHPMFAQAMAKDGFATPIEAGEVAVSAQVQVIYRFAEAPKPSL